MLYDLYFWSVGICNCNDDLISTLEMCSNPVIIPLELLSSTDCMWKEVEALLCNYAVCGLMPCFMCVDQTASTSNVD